MMIANTKLNRPLFADAEFLPKSGLPTPRQGNAVAVEIADKVAVYERIYVPNPAQTRVFAAFDELRELGRKGGRMLAIRNLAPSGSGKTSTAIEYQKHVLAMKRHADGDTPVVIVQLDLATSTKRLWSSLLYQVGDQFHDKGSGDAMRRRSYDYLKRRGVQLLIIDEIQHLSTMTSDRHDVTDAIKRVLDDGIVPLVLMGTDQAKAMLQRNIQLSNRMLPPCDLRPLDEGSERDYADFKGFVKRLDARMVESKVVRTSSHLDDPQTLACLHEISRGIIGRVVNLVRVALQSAIRRDADYVELCDLASATDNWAVAQGIIEINPFRHALKRDVR
ncbi:TniB family NTP-binding protein [Glacieibacterium megasporae]|uniref:TniB family NTP-binding protein n=1 Tax=Glacieibacterium megasporae TaxID=2835787 RepID=UPI001C1E2F13|nr:TniB family NTP-binding protein [Polymorphobacter megasporae]UAJ11078.1 TniB family NTP-binding protein [Polymorphobacter megasporae]